MLEFDLIFKMPLSVRVIILAPFYELGRKGSEMLINPPKVTQLKDRQALLWLDCAVCALNCWIALNQTPG